MNTSFEWDEMKNLDNIRNHGVNFQSPQYAFIDSKRVIAEDLTQSDKEKRYYIFGKVKGGVLTVRFTYRNQKIRIFGAGFWRKGKSIYEKQNQL